MSHHPRRPRAILVVAALAAAVVGLGACGHGGSSAEATEAGSVTVVGGQVAVPPNPDQAAARFLIQNTGSTADTLVAVSSPDADVVQIHRSEIDGQGRATMGEVSRLAVPARSEVTFEPGGLHVMLTGLHHRLRAGDTVSLRLTFVRAGVQTAELEVVDASAEPMDMDHHDGG